MTWKISLWFGESGTQALSRFRHIIDPGRSVVTEKYPVSEIPNNANATARYAIRSEPYKLVELKYCKLAAPL